MSASDVIPAVRIELEGVRQTAVHQLKHLQADLIAQTEAELERQLDPAKIGQLVKEQAEKAVKLAIEQAVQDHFRVYGGRKIIRENVNKILDEMFGPEE